MPNPFLEYLERQRAFVKEDSRESSFSLFHIPTQKFMAPTRGDKYVYPTKKEARNIIYMCCDSPHERSNWDIIELDSDGNPLVA